jgi:hypothetical protein
MRYSVPAYGDLKVRVIAMKSWGWHLSIRDWQKGTSSQCRLWIGAEVWIKLLEQRTTAQPNLLPMSPFVLPELVLRQSLHWLEVSGGYGSGRP